MHVHILWLIKKNYKQLNYCVRASVSREDFLKAFPISYLGIFNVLDPFYWRTDKEDNHIILVAFFQVESLQE
jgi:hypothetical protein